MAIAEAGSYSYKVPSLGTKGAFIQPPAAPEPFAPAEGQAQLPQMNEDLAYVSGLTDKYYDTYGQLKSYVQDMNAKGIDVTKPDYTDPSRMELFKTYKLLEANVMTTANQLKQQQKILTTLRPLEAQDKFRFLPGVNPNEQLITGKPMSDIGYSTELLPEVENANKKLSEGLTTEGDVERYRWTYLDEKNPQSVMTQLKSQLGAAQTPADKARIQNNINALLDPVRRADPALIRQDQKIRLSGTDENKIGLIKKIESIRLGNLEPKQYGFSYDKDGNVSATTKQLEGLNFGSYEDKKMTETGESVKNVDRIISNIRVYPNNRVVFEFKNTENGTVIPPEEVSSQSGEVILSKLIESNPRAFGSGSKLYEAMNKLGFVTDAGSLDTEALFGDSFQGVMKLGDNLMGELQSKQNNTQKAEAEIDKQLVGVEPGMIWEGDKKKLKFQIDEAVRELTISKGGTTGNFYVDEYKDLGLKKRGPYTADELKKAIKAAGYLDYYLKDGEDTTQPKQAPPLTSKQSAAVNAFAKQFGRQPSTSELEKIKAKYP